MASSSSNLVYNLAEGIYKITCKYEHDGEKYKTGGIKYKDCNCFLEYTNFKDDLIECICRRAKLDTLFNQKPDGDKFDTGNKWTTFNATD